MTTYIFYRKLEKTSQSHELTIRGLKKYLKYIGREIDTDSVMIKKKDSSQKPYFHGLEDIFHNVSHSGEWWVGAYGLTENGLDLQKCASNSEDKLAKRFFHDMEYRWLSNRPVDQFYRIWAYNESYVKFLGVGLSKGLDYFSVISQMNLDSDTDCVSGAEGVYQTEIPFPQRDYWLVLTTRNKEKVILEELEI